MAKRKKTPHQEVETRVRVASRLAHTLSRQDANLPPEFHRQWHEITQRFASAGFDVEVYNAPMILYKVGFETKLKSDQDFDFGPRSLCSNTRTVVAANAEDAIRRVKAEQIGSTFEWYDDEKEKDVIETVDAICVCWVGIVAEIDVP